MPSSPEQELEEIVFTRVTRLNAAVHGVVTGVILGLAIFLATLFLIIKGGETVGQHLGLLGEFFIGYQVTVVGSFIGLGYGFVAGFALGWFVATLYNQLLHLRKVD